MAKKNKEGYVFLPSFAASIARLPEDQQLDAFWAITNYGLYGKKPKNDNAIMLMLIDLVSPVIDTSKNRYKASVENGMKGAEYGKLGGRPRKTPQTKPQTKPQDIDIESDIESEVEADSEEEAEDQSEREKEKDVESKSYINQTRQTDDNFSFSGSSDSSSSAYPLTVGEVRTFCRDMGAYTDPERFFEYYQSRGWVMEDGKPVRDWKRLVMSKTWNVPEVATQHTAADPKIEEKETPPESKITSIPPPSDLEEVRQYCDKVKFEWGMDNFYEYFNETGWKLAGRPIKNWKVALMCWYEIEEGFRRRLEYITDANTARILYSNYSDRIF